jgi:UDP-3-O-[3-hydroxymyristoyl] glucosamine N-acyltransferase
LTTLGELATLVGAEVRGDSGLVVQGVGSLEGASPEQIALFGSAKLRDAALACRAGAFVVSIDLAELIDRPALLSPNPGLAMAKIAGFFHPRAAGVVGVHPSAVIAASARIAPSASIGPFVAIGDDSEIGEGVVVGPGVVIGRRCVVGAGARLHPRVVLYDDVVLGQRVEVHAGAVLGADGFGYVSDGKGLVKVPQVGGLEVGDDVEIGANSAVDRATYDHTRIGAGSKLDNLVQVGHNAQIGPSCVLCGQVGVAGSSSFGAGVVLGGQVGVADHVVLADGVQVAGGSVVLQSVSERGAKLGGYPARPLPQWRRDGVWQARLGELFRRVRRLETGEGREEES